MYKKRTFTPPVRTAPLPYEIYACTADGCKAEFTTESEVVAHYWRRHHSFDCRSFDPFEDLEGRDDYTITVIHFKTAAELDGYTRRVDYRVNKRICQWAGPGWYREDAGSEPCPSGCCTDDYLEIVPLDIEPLRALRRELDQTINQLEELQRSSAAE